VKFFLVPNFSQSKVPRVTKPPPTSPSEQKKKYIFFTLEAKNQLIFALHFNNGLISKVRKINVTLTFGIVTLWGH
jgi:hypothetical protein